jgi:hypothetical protein
MSVARGLIGFEARELFDEDGRPVAEVASPTYRDDTTELVACPYADSRAGEPMNRSALRQMTSAWPELLATIGGLGGGTVHGAWVAAIRGVALPLTAPIPVPRAISGVFKASLGLSQVFSAMLLQDDGIAEMPLAALGDGEAFFAALDQGRWLHGSRQVCAGTKPMIIAIFEALVAGSPPSPGIPEEAVALHVAWVASRQRLGREGEVHPWLRAVAAVPDRPPEHARRLFPAGQTPASVDRLLAVDLADREAAFQREIDRL